MKEKGIIVCFILFYNFDWKWEKKNHNNNKQNNYSTDTNV